MRRRRRADTTARGLRGRRLAAMPATATRIGDCISIRDGRLWIEELDTVEQTASVPMRWVETDTTEMFMADLLIEHALFRVIAASRAEAPGAQTADVVGISRAFDLLVSGARLPALEPDNVLAFLDNGAYQDACAAIFDSLPRPGTVPVSGSSKRSL